MANKFILLKECKTTFSVDTEGEEGLTSQGNSNYSSVNEFQRDLHCYQHGEALLADWAMRGGRIDTGGRLGKT